MFQFAYFILCMQMTSMFIHVIFPCPSLQVLQSFNCSMSETSRAMADATLMFVFLPSAYFNKWHNCKVRFLSVSGNVMPHPISKNTLHSVSLIPPSKHLQYMAEISDHGKTETQCSCQKRRRARHWGGKSFWRQNVKTVMKNNVKYKER